MRGRILNQHQPASPALYLKFSDAKPVRITRMTSIKQNPFKSAFLLSTFAFLLLIASATTLHAQISGGASIDSASGNGNGPKPKPTPTPSPTPAPPPLNDPIWSGGNGMWSSNGPTGWNGTGVPNSQGAIASFANTTGGTTTQDIVAGVTVGTITYSGNNSNNSRTITNTNGITMDQDGAGPGTATISNTNTNTGTSNALIINNGTLTLADDLLISNTGASTNATGAIQIASTIAGTGNITLSNASTALTQAGSIRIQTGTNTFTGSVLIQKGTVTFNNNNSFGNSANVITLGQSGQGDAALFSTAGGVVVPNNIVVASGSVGVLTLGSTSNATGTTGYSGTLMLNGNVNLTSASTGSNTITFSNNITGVGGVTKVGAGQITFSGTGNTYQGGTTVNAGTLTISATSSLGASTGALAVNNSNTGAGTAVVLNLNSAQTVGSLSGTIATPSSGTNTATINLNGVSTILTSNQSTDTTYAGVIAGTGGLTKSGNGTLTLTNSNTYSGVTTIDGGILDAGVLGNAGNNPSAIGTSPLAASNLVFGGGTLQYTGSTAASTNRLFTIGDSNGLTATIDASGNNTLSFTNNTGAIAFGGSGARTLTLTGTNAGVFAPTIGDGPGGATSLVKNGPGAWELTQTAANTYTGGTFVNNGTLDLDGTGSAGNAAIPGDLTIGDGIGAAGSAKVVIILTGQINNDSNVTINSDGLFDLRGQSEAIGSLAGSGVVDSTVGGPSELFTIGDSTSSAGTFTFSGVIQNTAGAVSVVKAGPGTEIFSGTNTYTGTTTVDAGKLFVNGSLASGSAVTVNNSGSVLGGTGTINGTVSIASSGAILEGGTGSTSQTLTIKGGLSMSSGSIIELALGSSGTHSTLALTGATASSFATTQHFSFINLGATTGTYQDIITGVTSNPFPTDTFVIDNSGFVGTFSWDSGDNGIDLNLTAVPEPSTYAAAALALLSLGYFQRKRLTQILMRTSVAAAK